MPPLALWMPYAAAIMGLAAALAWLTERVAGERRCATRFTYAVALIASPAIALLMHDADTPRPAMRSAQGSIAQHSMPLRTASGGGVVRSGHGMPPSSIKWLQYLEQPLRYAWAAVTGILALLLTIAVLSLRRLTGRARTAMVDGIEVRVDENLGPAASPFHGGAVIVPSWLQTLDAPLRRLVLAHESQHLAAADPTVLLAGAIVVVLLPWSPASWWMLRRLRLAIEIDCDARTLAVCGDTNAATRLLYAKLLILAAQQSSAVRRPPGSSLIVPAVSSHLSRRLHMLTHPASRMTRSRMLATAAATVAVAALAVAMPRPRLVTLVSEQPAEIVGLYWMVTPDMPSSKMLAPGREFTYLRLSSDGRSRMENVTVDASGDAVAPKVEVGPWSTEKWQVQPASSSGGAKLCWQLGASLQCSVYVRDAESGDITMYRDAVGGRIELVLRRASGR